MPAGTCAPSAVSSYKHADSGIERSHTLLTSPSIGWRLVKSATIGLGARWNAVDLTTVPESWNQTTVSGRRPASGIAARAFSENATTRAAGSSCARCSSAKVGTRIGLALSPAPVTGLPYETSDTSASSVHGTSLLPERSHHSFITMPCVQGSVPVPTVVWPAHVTESKYG